MFIVCRTNSYELRKLRDYSAPRRQAIRELEKESVLRSPGVVRAMLVVPREEFLPDEAKSYAYVDSPIPIGYGQTTSALHMTALFCEYSEMKLGQRVLEVGGGCGYMSCVYAEVVAASGQPHERWGHVWSAEIVQDLAELGRRNVERVGYSDRVTFLAADASEGINAGTNFDVIIVTSAAPDVPPELPAQLATGGVLLIPVGGAHFYQELLRIRKNRDGTLKSERLGGVAFVPMRGKRGWTN